MLIAAPTQITAHMTEDKAEPTASIRSSRASISLL